jgi:predicted nucleic acid-binding protein
VFIPGYDLADRAWTLARRLSLPTLYDAAFLAAAGGQAFWAADARLVASLGADRPDWVKILP